MLHGNILNMWPHDRRDHPTFWCLTHTTTPLYSRTIIISCNCLICQWPCVKTTNFPRSFSYDIHDQQIANKLAVLGNRLTSSELTDILEVEEVITKIHETINGQPYSYIVIYTLVNRFGLTIYFVTVNPWRSSNFTLFAKYKNLNKSTRGYEVKSLLWWNFALNLNGKLHVDKLWRTSSMNAHTIFKLSRVTLMYLKPFWENNAIRKSKQLYKAWRYGLRERFRWNDINEYSLFEVYGD